MRRNMLRPLWVILALLLLVEAWLWDHLEPIVARVVNFVPWRKLKVAVARRVDDLPPYAALVVFVVPFIVVLPMKFLGLYFIATGNWFGTVATLSLAKLLGLGVTAFVFDATRDKLLQISWFRRMYDWVMWARDWAYAQPEPIRARLPSRTHSAAAPPNFGGRRRRTPPAEPSGGSCACAAHIVIARPERSASV